jgi:hypothetical protein
MHPGIGRGGDDEQADGPAEPGGAPTALDARRDGRVPVSVATLIRPPEGPGREGEDTEERDE